MKPIPLGYCLLIVLTVGALGLWLSHTPKRVEAPYMLGSVEVTTVPSEPTQDNSATTTEPPKVLAALPSGSSTPTAIGSTTVTLPSTTMYLPNKDKVANEVFDCLSKKYYSSGKTLGICIRECSRELGVKRNLSVDERRVK